MMNERQPNSPKVRSLDIVAPINKGGTGGTSDKQACVNVGGIHQDNLDLPLQPAMLTSDTKVNPLEYPSSMVGGSSIRGPTFLYPTQVVTYTITNFDSLTSYNVSVSAGSCVLNNDTLTYKAPLTATIVTLTINGRSVSIDVREPWPLKPTLSVTTVGSNSAANAILTGNAFKMVVGSLAQQSADWSVSLDSAFTNIVYESKNDITNFTAWTSSLINLNTTYYARCRYRATNGIYSDYSSVVSFKTKSKYSPSTEEAKLIASDKAASDSFGWAVDCDVDATRVIVGAYLSKQASLLSNPGVAYVFKRTGTLWTQEAKIDISGLLSGAIRFGYDVAMDDTGTYVGIGSPYDANGLTSNAGSVYIYIRSGTTWTQQKIQYASDSAANNYFGTSVSINSEGTRMVVGAPGNNPGSAAAAGAAYVFLRSGTTWTQEAKLVASDRLASDAFGSSVSINSDATRIVVGSPLADPNSVSNSGAAYVYVRNGVTWAQEAKLIASDKVASDQLGYSVDITSDGTRIVVGANLSSSTGTTSAGAAYVYSRNGTAWIQEFRIVAFDKVANDRLGTSVSISGDGEKLIVSAIFSDPSSVADAGAVYIFRRLGSTWIQDSKITASDKAASDYFGSSIVMTPDSSRAVIGAYQEDPGGTSNAGSVYVYS